MPASKTAKHLRLSRLSDSSDSMSSKAAKNTACSTPSPLDDSNHGREQRNRAEKRRRDKLNSYISELASLVPMVYGAAKRPDKIGILRLSAAYLRLYYSSLNSKHAQHKFKWWPTFLQEDYFADLVQAMDGFFILTSVSGKIIYVSQSVENYLCHHDVELIGHSLFDFIHPSDLDRVKRELKNLSIFSSQQKNNLPCERVTFSARFRKRNQARSEVVTYQALHFSCCLSLNEGVIRSNKSLAVTSETAGGSSSLSNFGGLLKIHCKPLKINLLSELKITEAFREEYITRHGLDGKILFADHRISTITGYLPHEVVGMLAYDYISPVDIPVTHFAQNLMFSSSTGTGMVVYRLKTRNETMVYLKSTGHLQYEDDTGSKISHFICVNKLLCQEEGEQELMKFRDHYSPKIDEYLASLQSEQPCAIQAPKINELLCSPLQPEQSSAMQSPAMSEFLCSPLQPSSIQSSEIGELLCSPQQPDQPSSLQSPEMSELLCSPLQPGQPSSIQSSEIGELLCSPQQPEQPSALRSPEMSELLCSPLQPDCQATFQESSPEFPNYACQPSLSYNESLILSPENGSYHSISPNICDQSVNLTSVCNILPETFESCSNHSLEEVNDPLCHPVMNSNSELVAQQQVNVDNDRRLINNSMKFANFLGERNYYAELSIDPTVHSRKRNAAEVNGGGEVNDQKADCKMMKYDNCEAYTRNLDTLHRASNFNTNFYDNGNSGKTLKKASLTLTHLMRQCSNIPENGHCSVPKILSYKGDTVHSMSTGNHVFRESTQTVNDNFQPSNYRPALDDLGSMWYPKNKIGYFNVSHNVQGLDDVLFFQDC